LRLKVVGIATAVVTVLAAGCATSAENDSSGSTADANSRVTTEAGVSTDPLLVSTELGEVRGTNSAIPSVRAFLGLPFAAAPTGVDAWRPPQPREPYDGVFDATRKGGACPQNPGDSLSALTPIPEAVEDCLTIDVWAPDDAQGLPVMFWIHGGGLSSGSAHQDFYIGDDLAAGGVVVVSANYRVGPFGFLVTEELVDESEDGSFGNYGLADQTAGLEWVQRNAEAFGGDPGNVTIFGESAGGFSVCGHLASPASRGLFHRAIVQSGGGCGRLADPDDATAAGTEFLRAAGCADMACLRGRSFGELATVPFDPSLVGDGVTLTEPAVALAARGELDHIPVIIGSNGTESTLFTLSLSEVGDAELVELFGEVTDDPEALLALYPAAAYETNLDRYRTMLTEIRFTCPTIAFASVATNPTYVYHYLFASPNDPFGVGPTHGAELVSLFAHPEGIAGLPAVNPDLPEQAPDIAISEQMQAAWVAFATDGNPDDRWERYADAGRVTVIDEPVELVDEIRDGRCETVNELSGLDR
jgi:para-nitrobenzyl esterase